jgi:hypothetical protein
MRNIDYVNLEVSKSLGLSLDVVEKINKEYWREVKRKMNDLESASIYVKKVGTFSVSRFLINKKIYKTIGMIRALPNNKKFSPLKKEEIIKKMYIKLKKLLIQRNNIAKVYYERTNRLHKIDTEGA